MLLSLSLSTKPRDCLRFRALASFRFFCSKRCVACWCLTNPGIGGVCATVRGLLDLATSNFCGLPGAPRRAGSWSFFGASCGAVVARGPSRACVTRSRFVVRADGVWVGATRA